MGAGSSNPDVAPDQTRICCSAGPRRCANVDISGEDGDDRPLALPDKNDLGIAGSNVNGGAAVASSLPVLTVVGSGQQAATQGGHLPADAGLQGPVTDQRQQGFLGHGLGSFISSLGKSVDHLNSSGGSPASSLPASKRRISAVQFNTASSQVASNHTPSNGPETPTAPGPSANLMATMDEKKSVQSGQGDVQMTKEASEEDVTEQASLLRPLKRTPSFALKIIIENPRGIDQVYKIESHQLGKGAFGSVKKARVKATGAVRAVKFVLKSRMKGKEFLLQNEVSILKCVDHPNIIKLYELFEDQETIYMVMELCSGGALIDHLKRAGRFTEKEAARSMVQILRAMYYLHMHDIAHRDMKPANCLIVTRDSVTKGSLRVTDFGLSCRCSKDQIMTDRVGTPAFMSPQVIGRKYDRTCDTWSCGVTMYMLLCGKTPFSAKTDDEIRAKVTAGTFSFDAEAWVDVSEDGMNLIRRMLKVSTKQRCTIKEALQCEWLRKKALEGESQPAVDMSILLNLQGFRSLNKFKRAALCIIASMLDEEQTKSAREIFGMLDTDDDGKLDHDELRVRLENDDGEELEMNLLQYNDDGQIEPYTYTEFLAATFDRAEYCQKGICWAAFSTFDVDNDGFITKQELVKGWVLGELTISEMDHLVQDYDIDQDGTINFKEFMEMMRDGEGWTPSVKSPRSPTSRHTATDLHPSGESGRQSCSRASSLGSSSRGITSSRPNDAAGRAGGSRVSNNQLMNARSTDNLGSSEIKSGARNSQTTPRSARSVGSSAAKGRLLENPQDGTRSWANSSSLKETVQEEKPEKNNKRGSGFGIFQGMKSKNKR